MNKLPPKICPLPWISMETTPMGGCRPCCLAKEEIPDIDLHKDTLTDAYKSDYMKNLRQQFLDGEKPETCSRCWKEEAAGKMSKRMNTNVRLKHLIPKIDYLNTEPDQLWFLDLKLGNVCNLKCRICGSWSSSKWAKEEMDRDGGGKDHLAYKHLQMGKWPNAKGGFWDNLVDLTDDNRQIKYIEFTGGEPFMIKEAIDLIETMPYEAAKEMELHFNTNGTQPIPYMAFGHFKKVEIAFSIDNIGNRFNYERYGADWNIIDVRFPILMTQKPANVDHQLCFTINIQNVYYLDQLLMWVKQHNYFDSIHWNYLHDPWHMNVQYMTPECKKIVVDCIENNHKIVLSEYKDNWDQLINFIEAGPGSDGTVFCDYMKKTDKLRDENFANTYPHIAGAMGYD